MLLDLKAIQEKARAELAEETTKDAVAELKKLYVEQSKAELILRNIKRKIDGYLAQIEEDSIYKKAGVETDKTAG